MLTVPTKGFPKSVNKHRIRLDVLCDWIEASVLFLQNDSFLSQMDIADRLIEEERYVEQSFAMMGLKNAWAEIDRRARWTGTMLPTRLNSKRIERVADWREHPAYTFCLLLSLAPFYDWWKENDYLAQGDLFEGLTEASLKVQFNSWEIYRTGWTRNHAIRLREIAIQVAERLGEDLGDLETWDTPYKKELGLDILCYRPFPDLRRGIPVYLVQCASGNDWDIKLHTPDLSVWGDIIHFKNCPVRGFATPFTFLEDEYKRCVASVRGLFMERCRLLGADRIDKNWLSSSLQNDLIAWSEPRIAQLLAKSQ